MEAEGRRLIGEILVDLGFINFSQVNEARRMQMNHPNILLGEYLVGLGYVTPAQLLEALSLQVEDLSLGTPNQSVEIRHRGLPAKAMELVQLVSLPLFQAIANQLEEGFYVEGLGERQADDRILFLNKSLASWSGMKPEDFMNKSEISLINFATRFFDDPEGFLNKIRETISQRPEPATFALELSKPHKMTIEIRYFPLTNKSGEVIGGAGFLKRI